MQFAMKDRRPPPATGDRWNGAEPLDADYHVDSFANGREPPRIPSSHIKYKEYERCEFIYY